VILLRANWRPAHQDGQWRRWPRPPSRKPSPSGHHNDNKECDHGRGTATTMRRTLEATFRSCRDGHIDLASFAGSFASSGTSNLPKSAGRKVVGLCAELVLKAGTDEERGACVRLGWRHRSSIGDRRVQRKRANGRLPPERPAEIANHLPCAPLADSRDHGYSFCGCGRLLAPQTCAAPSDQGDAPGCCLPSQDQVGATGEETDA
jgi:hypothetical protein